MIDVQDAIDAIKLEELARATIAEANYRCHLEKQLTATNALENENLDLHTIDNSQRGFQTQNVGGEPTGETTVQGEQTKGRTKRQQKAVRKDRLNRELK